jgi:hypothetical protein
MGLSVYTYYETFKPHFSFRFKVDFLSNPSLYRLVQDIKLPTISINASDGRKRFGQTQIVLPFFEFGDQEIEITFVETDDMKVLDYMTNHLAWPNSPQTEDIIVTEYDDTLRNVIKRTLYTITLFSYSAPQWQNSGSPSNMTLTATYIVRKSRDITKDEYDLYNLPIYSPVVDMVQEMNVIGSSVDEGSAESEWQKFLGSLQDEQSEQEKLAEFNKKRQEAMMQPMAFETNTKAKEKKKEWDNKKQQLDDEIAETLIGGYEYLSEENQQKLENDAFKRYCNQQMNGTYRDFSMMTDEEKANMREKFDNLSDTEKYLLMYNIDTTDGLDANEKKIIEQNLGLMVNGGDLTKEDMKEALDRLSNKEEEFATAGKEWTDAVNHPEQGRGGENPKQQGTQTAGATQTAGSSNSNVGSEPVRYKQQNGTLQSLIKSGKLKDAKGNTISDISQLKYGDKLYVDGHEYKAVKYGDNWSLNSNVKGKDYSYERHANNPEEAYQNVTANGAVPYNLGAKSDGCIADGLDCMGYAGVVLKAVGAQVVDKNGKIVSNDVGSVFKNYSTQSFLDKGLKVVGPDGVDMKVLVAAKGGTGHIVIEYNGYIYESAGSTGVRKTEKSVWEKKYRGNHDYKNVMA